MSGQRRVSGALVMALAIMLAMPMAALLQMAEGAEAYSGINIEFQRPSFAGKSQTVPVTLKLSGGPAADEGGNYTYEVEFEGENSSEAKATPNTASDASGYFRFNLTMPSASGHTLTVTIIATSKSNYSAASTSTSMDFKIKVVEPIVITARVFNMGAVDANNVTAEFLADGELLGSKVFNLTAGESTLLSYNWTFLKIDSGKHVVTVVIDDASSIVEFSDGNNVLSRTIYVGGGGNPAGAILTAAVIVVAFFVILTYFQKPGKKSKKA